MSVRTQVALSGLEYDLLWSGLELGQHRYPVDVGSHGRTMEERATLRATAVTGLTDRGVMVDGKLAMDVEDMLRALDKPRVSIDLFGYARQLIKAVAVTGLNGTSVLVVQEDDQVFLNPIRDTALVGSIVAVLPGIPAGDGQSMSLPLDVLKKASLAPTDDDFQDDPFGDAEDRTDVDNLIRLGVSRPDAVHVTELAGSRIGGGQFGVSVFSRRPGVRPTRSSSMVTWFDTPRGRYMMFSDGSWVSLAPAGSDRIAWRVQQTVQELLA